jgi:hypothetical protein
MICKVKFVNIHGVGKLRTGTVKGVELGAYGIAELINMPAACMGVRERRL